MKAKLIFNLPEDARNFDLAVKATDACNALDDITQELQTKNKGLNDEELKIYEELA